MGGAENTDLRVLQPLTRYTTLGGVDGACMMLSFIPLLAMWEFMTFFLIYTLLYHIYPGDHEQPWKVLWGSR